MEENGIFHSRRKINEVQDSGNLQKLQILTMMLMRLVMELLLVQLVVIL